MNVDYIKIRQDEELNNSQMRAILQIIALGGVCLIPSDTGYSLATNPYNIRNVNNLRKLLPHSSGVPISLCFASRKMAKNYAIFSAKDERTFDTFSYSPITLICPVRNGIIRKNLEPVIEMLNTIGVRISDSPVERQIAEKLNIPITTCAIRDENGSIVRNFDDAVEVLRKRMQDINEKIPLATIKSSHIKYDKDSTILSFANPEVKILRIGMIDPNDIINAAKGITIYDAEDWT